jgi:sugar phosphate isomerase/epimerase
MMKLGCCLNMNAALEPKTGAESIPVIAAQGFDYIELPLAQVMELPAEGFRELLGAIRAGGIPLEACNNFFPATLRLTGEEARQEAALKYAGAACERAAAMGAKIVVLGSSGAKNIPPGFSYDRARGQLIELLGKLQDIAKPLGITVVLEPLNQKESNFIISAAEALGLVREVNLDNVKLLVDYYHMRMENENLAVIREAGKDLRHVHIASKEGRCFPKSGDGEEYPAFFRELNAISYDGRISVEGYSGNLDSDAALAINLLRPLMNLCC